MEFRTLDSKALFSDSHASRILGTERLSTLPHSAIYKRKEHGELPCSPRKPYRLCTSRSFNRDSQAEGAIQLVRPARFERATLGLEALGEKSRKPLIYKTPSAFYPIHMCIISFQCFQGFQIIFELVLLPICTHAPPCPVH